MSEGKGANIRLSQREEVRGGSVKVGGIIAKSMGADITAIGRFVDTIQKAVMATINPADKSEESSIKQRVKGKKVRKA